jgi:hypothetical protein
VIFIASVSFEGLRLRTANTNNQEMQAVDRPGELLTCESHACRSKCPQESVSADLQARLAKEHESCLRRGPPELAWAVIDVHLPEFFQGQRGCPQISGRDRVGHEFRSPGSPDQRGVDAGRLIMDGFPLSQHPSVGGGDVTVLTDGIWTDLAPELHVIGPRRRFEPCLLIADVMPLTGLGFHTRRAGPPITSIAEDGNV